MSPQELFKDKPLRLGVVAALATIAALPADALVLPSKPLALSSSWDCRAGKNSDWLCRSTASNDYDQTLERATYSRQNIERQNPERRSSERRYSERNDSAYKEPERRIAEYQNPASRYRAQREQQPEYQAYQPQRTAPKRYREQPRSYNPAYEEPARYASHDQETEQTNVQSLLSARDGSYVIQWLAAHDQQSLKDLQRRFPFLEQSTLVSYRRNNKVWYVLLDGPFGSRESAMAALSSPPRLMMTDKLYPWTRSLTSIQKLDLIMPHEIEPVPSYDQPTVADRYEYQQPARQPNRRLFASITPAYPQIEPTYESRDYNPDPYAPVEDQYRSRNRGYEPEYQEVDQNFNNPRRSYSEYREPNDVRRARSQARRYYQEDPPKPKRRSYRRYEEPKAPAEKPKAEFEGQPQDIMSAPDGSYTIQWLTSPRRETLERTKRRYSQLSNAEIVQYRKGSRKWYLLVSELYFSRSEASEALNEPWLARISSRLYPRVRSVNSLRVLTSNSSRTVAKQHSVQASSPLNEIIKSPDGTYTIQWFAANSPTAVEKMKQRFPELRTAITAYYRKNQKDWYVLIQGQYNSSRDAISAIKSPQLQNAVRVLHPWTRPVKSLKKLKISDA